jgi:hypothetical protein
MQDSFCGSFGNIFSTFDLDFTFHFFTSAKGLGHDRGRKPKSPNVNFSLDVEPLKCSHVSNKNDGVLNLIFKSILLVANEWVPPYQAVLQLLKHFLSDNSPNYRIPLTKSRR